MSRRITASVIALAIALGLVLFAAVYPVKYVVYYPGPTFDVLGKTGDGRVLTVEGHQAYRDAGRLRMLTVSPTGPEEKVSMLRALAGWASPNDAVYPREDIYPSTATRKSVRQESQQEMTSSQDEAVAAALTALKIPYTTAVKVASIEKGSPASGKLKVGDLISSVNGVKVSGTDQLIKLVQAVGVGDAARLQVSRKGKPTEVSVPTVASTTAKGKSAIKVAIAPSYDFPFQVGIHLSSDIGGPSAGMMFAMGIYDLLTPGSLTAGKDIAGTGEITPAGKVGEIGGIQQKMVAAQAAGARLFLVPAGNCGEALAGHYDSKKMRLVKVSTLQQAISDVETWSKDPNASLTRCTR